MPVISHDVSTKTKGHTIIHFDEGLVGFSECKDFLWIEDDSIVPFRLLQSAQKEVSFLILEASMVVADYCRHIPAREWESIGLSVADAQHAAFVICVLGRSSSESTGNFQAPLIINYKKMIGRQIILTDTALSVRQPLV
jgi:flagellar assembly factor FliW